MKFNRISPMIHTDIENTYEGIYSPWGSTPRVSIPQERGGDECNGVSP
jgi:putative transposon-encoded protein